MVVCSHCGRESRAADRFCQYCGQQLDPGNGHLVAAFAPRYAGASDDPAEWRGPLAEAPAAHPSEQHSSQDASQTFSQPSTHARLVVRQVPETPEEGHSSVADTASREYQLDGGDIAIGRAPSCDVVLEGDQLASRRHALLRRKGDVYTVVDLGSSNGTYVNDLEIREATALKEGDVITIGAHEIVFSTAPASPHASIPGAALATSPAAPLGETDPSASAINAPLFSTLDQSNALDEQRISDGAGIASPEAPAEDVGAQPLPSDVVLPPDSRTAAQAESAAVDTSATFDGGSVPAPAASNADDVPMEVASPGDAAASAAVAAASGADVAAATPAPAAAAGSDLDGLRAQLAEISTALARKADEEARSAERMRATLADARDRLAILSEQHTRQPESAAPADAPVLPAANVSELVSVARQAAENPRHLDYLTSLAAHASEIAAALEALEARQASTQSSSGNAEMLDVLDELRARLDDALNQH